MANTTTTYPWQFQRIGGIDQVILRNAQDIMHLDELDPKLWVALSCPASGLELDAKTLSLLDSNNDDRIRIPDIVDAVKWLKTRLIKLDSLIECASELPLAAIDSTTENGSRLLATAKAILANIGKNDQNFVSVDDLNASTLVNSSNLFNGDGIVPPTNKIANDLQDFIKDALSVMGGVKDASGLDGIDNKIASAFKQSLEEWVKWHKNVSSATTPLANDTEEAWQLVLQLKDKINDYFLRTELASYAPQAEKSLNVDEKYIVPMDNGLLADSALAELPLSKVEANADLNLTSGLNPIWRDKVLRLMSLVKPFLSSQNALSQTDWIHIQKMLTPYSTVVASKPALTKVDTTIAPKITIDKLGEAKIDQLLNSDLFERFAELADKDSKTPAAASDIADVEKLVVFHRHLYRLLMNFVSFHDFFDLDTRTAAFQTGRLFIDGRCCTLCIPVADIAKHTTLANYSELFLMYCECTRKTPPINGTQQKQTIVAAMTAGDADFLLDGRNGVFVDNKGNDWDAKVVKIISKPISISQAIWDPYKRIGRFITEQINKWATSKDSAIINSATQTTQTADPVKFDIGKSMGIFAAIGLALGALGTAIASIASSLFQLYWWQLPFVFLGIFLIISGPSVILAWIKLRQRTLGPLLEASGWAINGKIKINLFLGTQLTSKAELPKNASRSLIDPMKKNRYKYYLAFFIALMIGIAAASGWLWYDGYFDSPAQSTSATVQQAPVDTPIAEGGSPINTTK
ncbi:hypothetical protein DES39_0130 [Orbus hercynius]|uniref:EF-hand domain-containing protein n=1 Tax=Orbus hercynius TaxID=593135 RepID=A0A495RI26_9GAMM|nr:hypothetical protein [Orbus hercynius]RKS86924.1 hypothetical protein DES39_0130 [Orbus hercynius]